MNNYDKGNALLTGMFTGSHTALSDRDGRPQCNESGAPIPSCTRGSNAGKPMLRRSASWSASGSSTPWPCNALVDCRMPGIWVGVAWRSTGGMLCTRPWAMRNRIDASRPGCTTPSEVSDRMDSTLGSRGQIVLLPSVGLIR